MNSTTCYLPPTCLLPDQTRPTGPFPSNLARTNVLFDTILEPSPDLPAARNCYVEPLLCSRASIGPETTRGTKPLLLLWLLSLPLLPPLLPLLLDALSGRSAPTRAWTALDLVATPRQFLAGPTWLETRLGIPHPVYYPHQQERSPQPASSSPDRSRDLHECASVKSATTWTAPHLSLHHPPTYLPHLPTTYLPTLLTHPPHYLNSQQHPHCVHGSHDRRLSLAAPTGPLHLSTCSSPPIDYRNLLHRFFVFCFFFFFFCCRRRCLVSTLTPLLYHSVSHYPCNSRVPSRRARVPADTSSLARFLVY